MCGWEAEKVFSRFETDVMALMGQQRLVGAWEAQDGGPFAVGAGLPHDLSVQPEGDLCGGEVSVEVEEAGVGALGLAREGER